MNDPNLDPTIIKCLHDLFGADSSDVSDASLMTRYIEHRDKFAFELLVRRHMTTVHRTCRAVLRDHHSAEDAAQAVFMILARKAETVRNREAMVGWLVQTAYRVAVHASRKIERRNAPQVQVALQEITETRKERDGEVDAILHQAIFGLSEHHRSPIVLCFFEGLSQREAAKRLCLPLGTFRVRLERAKELLQREVTRRGLVLSSVGVASILTVNSVSGMGAAKLNFIIDTAFTFGTSKAAHCATPFSVELAQSCMRESFAVNLRFAVGIALACTTAAFIFAAGFMDSGIRESVKPQFTVAPIPERQKEDEKIWAEINKKDIEAFCNFHADYGRFVEYKEDISIFWRFHPESEPANGLPGFYFDFYSRLDGANPLEVPTINVPFGLHFDFANIGIHADQDDGMKRLRVQMFEQITKQKNLVYLKLVNIRLRTDDLKALASLKKLEYLDISNCWFDGKGAEVLTEIPGLRYLGIGSEALSDEDWKTLSHFKALETLSLGSVWSKSENPLDGKHLRMLGDPPKLTTLFMTAPLAENMNELKHIKRLKTLILFGYRGGFKELNNVENLESLSVQKLDSNDFQYLPSLHRLTKLAIIETKMDDGFPKALSEMKSLKVLNLQKCKLPAETVHRIAQLQDLEILSLRDTQTSDEDMKEFKHLKKIRKINLANTRVTNKGIQELSASTSLESLNVSGTSVTEEGLEALRKTPRAKAKRNIRSWEKYEDGVQEPKNSYPNCLLNPGTTGMLGNQRIR